MAAAQAPASADLWRLSAASLAAPPALETGATAAFWNPAAIAGDARLRVGVQVLQTPDVLGIGGLVGGVTYTISRGVATQLLVARTEVGDLVRTSTSPTSDLGAIPVYEQLVGLGAALQQGPLSGGALLRAHDARFDAERDHGVTVDAGVRLALGHLALAAATHFFPLDAATRDLTDFYAAAEAQPLSTTLWGAAARIWLRWGVSARRGGGAEHALGAGLALNQRFRLDAQAVRETGYVDASWRPVLGIQFRVGRYAVAAARSTGLGGIGASYRVGLDVDVVR